jgi:hypothetical protein
MLLLIKHRYPVPGAILGALSNVAFIALGIAGHSELMVVTSVAFLALSIVQTAHRRPRSIPQARP